MNDTTRDIYKKQFEIIESQPLGKRIKNLFEMTELSREIIKNRIKEANPNITETELRVEIFKTFYRQDFDSITLDQISESLTKFMERSEDAI